MKLSDIPNTNSKILIQTALKLGIKVELLDEEKLKLRLTENGKSHVVTKKSFGLNPSRSIKLTRNKRKTSELFIKHNIPVPNAIEIHSLKDLKTTSLPPFPVVCKPAEGEKGHDVFVGIRDKKTLRKTAESALKKVNAVIIQEYIGGNDMRFLVLNGKVIGAVRRRPPEITGDGKSTIEQLILKHNENLLMQREKTARRMQNRILNWPRVSWHLENQGLSLQSILPKGKNITPYPIANFQAGGTVETIPVKKIHPSIIKLIEKTARITGLVVCGIDIIVKDHTKPALTGSDPVNSANAVVLEVNSDPSLRLHEWPNKGRSQPVTKKLLKYMLKE